jgi:hypothetical protein
VSRLSSSFFLCELVTSARFVTSASTPPCKILDGQLQVFQLFLSSTRNRCNQLQVAGTVTVNCQDSDSDSDSVPTKMDAAVTRGSRRGKRL